MKNCQNCIFCEMYDDNNSLCTQLEIWVDNNCAIQCIYFVLEGGSDE